MKPIDLPTIDARLHARLAQLDMSGPVADILELLVREGLDQLPMPGAGATLTRWRALAVVAEHDLSLVKLYEGHTDALAILAELEPGLAAAGTWGVWAAEAPQGRARIATVGDRLLRLDGGKCWCSGAASASHALLTAWEADADAPQLVRIALAEPGLRVIGDAWQAVGMARSASLDVAFENVRAHPVGSPGAYLSRPGFWHGGAGIAACWFGGARGIAKALHRAVGHRAAVSHGAAVSDSASSPNESARTVPHRASAGEPARARPPFKMAALGKIDVALRSTAALLREAADWIDRHPLDDASDVALRVRLATADCARLVLDEAGRALGAGPYCRDAHFARLAADLPVFIRQSHAERDFAALAEHVADARELPWTL